MIIGKGVWETARRRIAELEFNLAEKDKEIERLRSLLEDVRFYVWKDGAMPEELLSEIDQALEEEE